MFILLLPHTSCCCVCMCVTMTRIVYTCSQGRPGSAGDTGAVGSDGPRGPQGPSGARGSEGSPGPAVSNHTHLMYIHMACIRILHNTSFICIAHLHSLYSHQHTIFSPFLYFPFLPPKLPSPPPLGKHWTTRSTRCCRT